MQVPRALDCGMAKTEHAKWESAPQAHDYPAAAAFLALMSSPTLVGALVAHLKDGPTVTHAAKDILRAARLPLLPRDDPSVSKDLKQVIKGRRLSPVLLVRGDLGQGHPLVIADGYHRVCAAHHLEEDVQVPCRIASLDDLRRSATEPSVPG